MTERQQSPFQFHEGEKDSLTGVWRRSVFGELNKAFKNRPGDEVWSMLIIDIDHFKLINDVYGHVVGDNVIKQVADILLRNTRKSDILLRYGGDEFVLVIPGTEQTRAVNYPQRILEELDTVMFPQNIKVGLSMGMAESYVNERDLEHMLARADKALYQAKEGGRGRISFYARPDEMIHTRGPTFEHFVDRQHESRQLRAILDETIAGGSRLVVVSGEPGVGKTRFVKELLHYTKFRRCLYIPGKCSTYGGTESYATVLKPIQKTILSLSGDEQAEILRKASSVHPATATLLPSLKINAAPDTSHYDEEHLKYRIFEDITGLMRNLARLHPCVFVLDDLQWISVTDFELFSYLVRNNREARILFIVTMRRPFDDYPEVFRRLKVLRAIVNVVPLDLERLDDEYAGHMIMFALRDPNIPADILNRIVRQSGGNPFYLRELVKSLYEQGSIRAHESGGWSYNIADDMKLPETIAEVIATRFNRLNELSQELLGIGSLAIDSFQLDLLCNVSKQPQVQVVKALDQPLNMEFISEEPTKGGRLTYRFVHESTKSYVHDNLSRSMMSVFHLRMGEYYERLYVNGQEHLVINTAHHYNQCSDTQKAKTYALKAAYFAKSRQANHEIIKWLEIYISFIDTEKDQPEKTFAAYKLLGSICSLTGQGDKAEASLTKALTLASTQLEKGEIYYRIAVNFRNRSKHAEARRNYIRGLDLVTDPVIRAAILSDLIFIDCIEGHHKEGSDKSEELHRLTDSCTDVQAKEHVLAKYNFSKGHLKDITGLKNESFQYYNKALELHHKHHNLSSEAAALNNMSGVLISEGNYEKRLELLRKAEQINMKIGRAFALAIAYNNIAYVYYNLNQKDLAIEYCNRCIYLAKGIGYERVVAYAKSYTASLLEGKGNYTSAEKNYREAMEISKKLGLNNMTIELYLLYAEFLLKRGRFSDVQDILDHLRQESDKGHMNEENKLAFMFIQGLALHLGSNTSDTHSQQKAEKVFLEVCKHDDQYAFLVKMKTRYYLAQCFRIQGKENEYKRVIKESAASIKIHLDAIKSKMFRESFSESAIIKDFLSEHKNLETPV
jgi:diguanylate cyclase (GGDEF)-like protein